jgi:hypothetical protein
MHFQCFCSPRLCPFIHTGRQCRGRKWRVHGGRRCRQGAGAVRLHRAHSAQQQTSTDPGESYRARCDFPMQHRATTRYHGILKLWCCHSILFTHIGMLHSCSQVTMEDLSKGQRIGNYSIDFKRKGATTWVIINDSLHTVGIPTEKMWKLPLFTEVRDMNRNGRLSSLDRRCSCRQCSHPMHRSHCSRELRVKISAPVTGQTVICFVAALLPSLHRANSYAPLDR